MGNRESSALRRLRKRFQFSLWRRNRANGGTGSRLCLLAGGHLQIIWHLFQAVGARHFDSGQPVFRADLLDHLSSRIRHDRPDRRCLVRLDVGFPALGVLYLRKNSLGNDAHNVSPESDCADSSASQVIVISLGSPWLRLPLWFDGLEQPRCRDRDAVHSGMAGPPILAGNAPNSALRRKRHAWISYDLDALVCEEHRDVSPIRAVSHKPGPGTADRE